MPGAAQPTNLWRRHEAQLMVKENPVAFAVAGVLLLLLLGRLLSR